MQTTTLFCIRPTTRNIGNDLIHKATCDQIRSVFGQDVALISVPALQGAQYGGLTAAQVYDINRLADGLIIGGGNLFENGQLTFDAQAFAALRVPLMLMGISHGRIHDARGALVDRTDSMPPDVIRRLCERASIVLVRDRGTENLLGTLGVQRVEVGGCPSLFISGPAADDAARQRVLLSIRHPARMSVPPELQWRTAADLRGLIDALKREYGANVSLICHDYKDLEFAQGFPDTPCLYFDDVDPYIDALGRARLAITYRLHAFLPCLAFGTPCIHLSYDERGREMVATAGMDAWDIDLIKEPNVVSAVMQRAGDLARYNELRSAAQDAILALQATSDSALRRFAAGVAEFKGEQRGVR